MEFLDPGQLSDGELELVLVERRPGDLSRAYVPSYIFELRVDGVRAGDIDFRAGKTLDIEQYGGHFGYEVEPAFRGHHYAERAVRLLLPLARSHGLRTIWITCNPDNFASRRTCERLGAEFVEIVDMPHIDRYADSGREKCRYRLDL